MNIKLVPVLAALSLLLVLAIEARQPKIEAGKTKILQDENYRSKYSYSSSNYGQNDLLSELPSSNEIDSDRIVLPESLKSLVQTGIRFTLAQTPIVDHVKVDTAMTLINNASFKLSKPATLIKAIKVIAVTIATFIATSFFFPGAYHTIEALLSDPKNKLNFDKFFSNGISEKSVIGAISTNTDDILNRVGLQDNSCRKRSICYLGQAVKCMFPETSQTFAKFVSDNFSFMDYKENKYSKAFLDGFVNRTCTTIEDKDGPDCLQNIFSLMVPRTNDPSRTHRSLTPNKS